MQLKTLMTVLLFASMLFAGISPLVAQTTNFTVHGITSFQANNVLSTGDTLNLIKCRIQVTDTTDLTKIHVKLGTSLHGEELADDVFTFDVTSGLPAGMNYERDGNIIILTLGSFRPNVYYLDVKLEDAFGNMSTTRSVRF